MPVLEVEVVLGVHHFGSAGWKPGSLHTARAELAAQGRNGSIRHCGGRALHGHHRREQLPLQHLPDHGGYHKLVGLDVRQPSGACALWMRACCARVVRVVLSTAR